MSAFARNAWGVLRHAPCPARPTVALVECATPIHVHIHMSIQRQRQRQRTPTRSTSNPAREKRREIQDPQPSSDRRRRKISTAAAAWPSHCAHASKQTRTYVPPLRAVGRAGAGLRLLSTPQRQNCCIGEVEALRSAAVGSRGITGWSIPAEHGWLYNARPERRNRGGGAGCLYGRVL